jgi:hypothetical protein
MRIIENKIENHRLKSVTNHGLKSITNHRLKSMATINHRINSMATKSVVPYGTWITNPVGMIDLVTLGFIPGLRPERQGQKSPIGATDIHIYLTSNQTKN